MVLLTLQELCLFSIRDSIENGQRPPADKLPPPLRQRIFETIVKHGTLNNPECVDVLGSIEYLDGFTRIDTQNGRSNDSAFLERAAESIGRFDPSTKTSIADGIVRLDLNIYVHLNDADAARLISKCPHLETLNMDVYRTHDGCYPGCTNGYWSVLNRLAVNDTCRSVLESVKELSFVDHWFYIALRNDSPLLEFHALTSLKLNNCDVYASAWGKLLETTQNTLQILSAINVLTFDDGRVDDDWILPCSMPHLTSFEYIDMFAAIVVPVHLFKCDALERVHVQVDLSSDYYNGGRGITEHDLEKLSSIQQSIKSVDLSVIIGPGFLDDSKSQKAIVDQFFNQFGPDVKSLEITNYSKIEYKITAIDRCPNLEQLTMHFDGEEGVDEETVRCLLNFFRDLERTEKLRKLRLSGYYDHSVLDAIFENCRNLPELSIESCLQLSDNHLIDFASRCIALEKFEIISCNNVGDNGLMAILIARGRHLTRFVAIDSGSSILSPRTVTITDKTWMTMIDRCPNVVQIAELSEELEEARRQKSFHRFVSRD